MTRHAFAHGMTKTITFLGYRLFSEEGKIKAEVSGAAAEKFWANLNLIEGQLQVDLTGKIDKQNATKLVAEFRSYTKAWCAAFSEADDVSDYKKITDLRYYKYMKRFQLNPEKVYTAIQMLPLVKVEEVGSGV